MAVILAFGRLMQIELYFMVNSGYIGRQYLKKKNQRGTKNKRRGCFEHENGNWRKNKGYS